MISLSVLFWVPTVHCRQPSEVLGRIISDGLSDKYQADSLSLALTKGLHLISNSGHRAVQKLWILQHLLVPRL